MKKATTAIATFVPLLLSPVALSGEPRQPDPPVVLEPESPSSDWKFELGLYGFLAGIDATASVGDLSVETNFKFKDILDNLDATFMGAGSASNGRFRIAADILYLGVSGDASPRGPLYDEADLELDSLIISLNGTYRVWERSDSFLELGAGVRYLGMDTDVKVRDGDGILPTMRESASDDLWDGLGVVRFHYQFSPKWFFRFYGDIGAGDSHLTWQIFATFGYAINDRAALLLGWRHLEYDVRSGPAKVDVFFSGPQIGAGFRF